MMGKLLNDKKLTFNELLERVPIGREALLRRVNSGDIPCIDLRDTGRTGHKRGTRGLIFVESQIENLLEKNVLGHAWKMRP